jgi:hypothetical protein
LLGEESAQHFGCVTFREEATWKTERDRQFITLAAGSIPWEDFILEIFWIVTHSSLIDKYICLAAIFIPNFQETDFSRMLLPVGKPTEYHVP